MTYNIPSTANLPLVFGSNKGEGSTAIDTVPCEQCPPAALRQEENSPADGAIIEAFACRCNVDTIVRQQRNVVGQHPTMLPVNDLGKELNKTFQFRIHLVDQSCNWGAGGDGKADLIFYLEAKHDNTVGKLPRTEHPCLK